MRKQSIVFHATIICALVLALSTVALAADPHVGTWKLNVARSKVNSETAYKSLMVKIAAQENGHTFVADGVDANGIAIHIEFAAKFDGKDYPITGSPTLDVIAVRKIDANTVDYVVKKDGKEAGSGRVVISKDGKTRTQTSKSKDAQGRNVNNIEIFDRQ
jgi:hypothetical protein